MSEDQFGPWEQDPMYGTVRRLISNGQRSAMDAAPVVPPGAVIPATQFGGASAYGGTSAPTSRGPSLSEIKRAYESLRELVAAAAAKYGVIPPCTVFTDMECGESVLGALNELVKEISPIASQLASQSRRSSSDSALLDSFNIASKIVRDGGAYGALARPRVPANAAMDDSEPVQSPTQFFVGVDYKEGKRRYDAHLARTGK
jgi:hypothetical protein